MIRRLVFPLALAAGLVSPKSADAQLATWCDGADTSMCFSVLNYSVLVNDTRPASYYWRALLDGSLSGVPNATDYFVSLTLSYPTLGGGVNGAIMHGLCPPEAVCSLEAGGSTSTPSLFGIMPATAPTLKEMTELTVYLAEVLPWEDGATLGAEVFSCSPNGTSTRAERCVSVPEPESMALLASGLMMLGFVGWRTRREA